MQAVELPIASTEPEAASAAPARGIARGGAEWLEADGLGGFASGTVSGVRTRRYHALLLSAVTPPTGRFVLVNGLEAWLETPDGTIALSSQRYGPDVVHPDGASRIESFEPEPWPRWRFRLGEGRFLEQELFVPRGQQLVVISWRLSGPREGPSMENAVLHVRPLLSGRDYHSLHHENPGFRFEAAVEGERVSFTPYAGVPGIEARLNGRYLHGPLWYRNFLYSEERDRGLDCTEDLASPGTFSWDQSSGEAVLLLAARTGAGAPHPAGASALSRAGELRAAERRRRAAFPSALHRAADSYLVTRGGGKTIVAGYPWFTDWGRDTFIALRGICLAAGRLDEAREILLQWAGAVSEGMLPNRFPDHGESPEYNSVDASLWYIVAVHDFLAAASRAKRTVSRDGTKALEGAVDAILSGYQRGTRYGIRADSDGLLRAGEPGVQLTWMDAKVGDWVVTPRVGKPVEVEALWINALWIGSRSSKRWLEPLARARSAFEERFWLEEAGYLADVVDDGHQSGKIDASFRPNQVLAAGGLPLAIMEGERARRIVDAVEERLWTPLGLRSLAPGSPAYAPRYRGDVRARDGAYHQGTVWPWLAGPFVEAWVRVRGGTAEARREARGRFLEPLLHSSGESGLGHLPEIADAEPPHSPRGCPFQAWSVGEALRLREVVLADG
jgi:predicted glycogen debranching enzyme